jgi:hypothetical protein
LAPLRDLHGEVEGRLDGRDERLVAETVKRLSLFGYFARGRTLGDVHSSAFAASESRREQGAEDNS